MPGNFLIAQRSLDEISLRDNINNLIQCCRMELVSAKQSKCIILALEPGLSFGDKMPSSGWNEALITYVLAASSNIDTNTIPKIVYDNGWARNGAMKNGKSFYGIQLPSALIMAARFSFRIILSWVLIRKT